MDALDWRVPLMLLFVRNFWLKLSAWRKNSVMFTLSAMSLALSLMRFCRSMAPSILKLPPIA